VADLKRSKTLCNECVVILSLMDDDRVLMKFTMLYVMDLRKDLRLCTGVERLLDNECNMNENPNVFP